MSGYDHVTDLKQYCKGKRKKHMVILEDNLLPIKCAICEKSITKEQGNRTWIFPKEKTIVPMHYKCAWNALFTDIYRLGRRMQVLGLM